MSSTPREPDARDVSLVTISYRGDLEIAGELCRSVDRYLTPDVEHLLVVPRSDVALFAPLASARRRIIVREEIMPPGYVKLPAPHDIRIGGFHRLLRELWLTPVGIKRGWIVQQIAKLAATTYCDRETIVFADSDMELTGPLSVARLVEHGRTRLYRVPDVTGDSADHVRWHGVACRMLGIDPPGFQGADYIGQLITWSRSDLDLLQQRITEVGRRRWDTVVASQRSVSEYILYGIFVDRVLGEAASHHFFSAEDLVHASWFYDLTAPSGMADFVADFSPEKIGVAIQSTERFTLEERRELITQMTRDAASKM